MELKNITAKGLDNIIEDLRGMNESAIGSYLYKGFKVQISKYRAGGNERFYILYRKRREKGLCVKCGEKVGDKNPRTGKTYRLCAHHRELENNS